jgi:hypothetical protein
MEASAIDQPLKSPFHKVKGFLNPPMDIEPRLYVSAKA